MKSTRLKHILPIILAASLAFSQLGCPSVNKDEQVDFSYETASVAIYNPDWDIIPVPNDLLNPVWHEKAGITVTGLVDTAPCDVCMDIRMVDAEEVESAAELGYSAPLDSDLTAWLKRSMNMMNGYIPDIIPEFPFTQLVDMDSIVKYQSGNGSDNAESANFFFLDITDAENPKVIQPDEYYLIFNYASKEEMPYNLTLRFPPAGTPLPELFHQGHTYLIVLTGVNDKGIKDTDGKVFIADQPMALFMGDRPYVASDGSSRMNLFSDIDYVRDLEMARLLTDYGLKIWEGQVGDKRKRGEVISSFSFSINDNPMPRFFNQVPALTRNNPIIPEYGDAAEYETRAPVGFEPSFKLSRRIETSTANKDSVKLYRKVDEGKYKPLGAKIEATNSEDEVTIKLIPDVPLAAGETYLVAATGEIKGEDGLDAMADIYFMLARAPMSLIDKDGWLTEKPASPYIDIRIEALVAMIDLGLNTVMEMSQDAFNHTPQSAFDDATQIYNLLLSQLEDIRVDYAEPIAWLYDNNQVTDPNDLVLAYTFTMESIDIPDGDEDPVADGDMDFNVPETPIGPDDMGEKNLVDVDLSGFFRLYAKFEYVLLPEPVELFITGMFTQTGVITEGTAKLDYVLYVGGEPMPAVEPAIIDAEGKFTTFLPNFVIPSSLVDILEEDAIGDVTMNGEIYNSNAALGTITADLRGAKLVDLPPVDITLEGNFGALRVEQ